jgi:hypothetical protein
MPRHKITAVWPDGSSFHVTKGEAQQIVADNLGEWDGEKTIRLKKEGWSGGSLSRKVGAPLAVAAQRGEPWAKVAVRETTRRNT